MSNNPLFVKMAEDKIFGFWIYLMSDCVLFATLFTTFAILSNGPIVNTTGTHLFDLPSILIETFCLLTSSFTFGLASFAMHQDNKKLLMIWLAITFILGAGFVGLEISEFHHFILSGKGPDQNAALSAFFTLVGTHGLHVCFGLLWIAVMMIQILKKGLTLATRTQLILLSLFWHFLDIIWIFLFTFVYLMGSL